MSITLIQLADIENNYLTTLPTEFSQLQSLGDGSSVNNNYLDCTYLATLGILPAGSTMCDSSTQNSLVQT